MNGVANVFTDIIHLPKKQSLQPEYNCHEEQLRKIKIFKICSACNEENCRGAHEYLKPLSLCSCIGKELVFS